MIVAHQARSSTKCRTRRPAGISPPERGRRYPTAMAAHALMSAPQSIAWSPVSSSPPARMAISAACSKYSPRIGVMSTTDQPPPGRTWWLPAPSAPPATCCTSGGPDATLVSHRVRGQPTVLDIIGRELSGVLVFTLRGEIIQAVHVIAGPAKFSCLGFQLASAVQPCLPAWTPLRRCRVVLVGAATTRRQGRGAARLLLELGAGISVQRGHGDGLAAEGCPPSQPYRTRSRGLGAWPGPGQICTRSGGDASAAAPDRQPVSPRCQESKWNWTE